MGSSSPLKEPYGLLKILTGHFATVPVLTSRPAAAALAAGSHRDEYATGAGRLRLKERKVYIIT